MKCNLRKLFLFTIGSAACIASSAQMIKAPTNTKPAGTNDTKKKTASKPQVKFKDDDDNKADSVATGKHVDNTFTYLILKANRSSAINVNINDNESGKIRAGMSKKIPLNNSDELRISLNDGQGNQYDTTFIVDEKDAGKNITVAFPEVDYAAIKAEELRLRKERDDQIRLQKEEELRKIKEAEEALKQQRIGLLNETENDLKDLVKLSLADKASLQQLIDKVKKGESSITNDLLKAQETFFCRQESACSEH